MLKINGSGHVSFLCLAEEEENYPHRWAGSDGENNVIASHMTFDQHPSSIRKFDPSDPLNRHMSDIEYDDGGGPTIDEKYSFPYTG